jgi:hypothetical protein
MNALLWSLLAAVPAVGMEYLYRVLPQSWWHYLYIWAPFSLLISYCICKLVTQPGVPLVGALIIWSLAIMGTRVAVTLFLLHDRVAPGTWVALALLLAGRVAQAVWK